MNNFNKKTYNFLIESIISFLHGECGDGDVVVLITEPWDYNIFLDSFKEKYYGNIINHINNETVIFSYDQESVTITKDFNYFNNIPSWVLYKVHLGVNK